MLSRRRFIVASAAFAISGPALAAGPVVAVYKTRSCGCCAAWVEHMRESGFELTVTNLDFGSLGVVKREAGIKPELSSCHTAKVDGYVIEGHVPAQDVRRLLRERPTGIVGLSVPGMPIGSPGMEDGDARDAYDVIAIRDDGTTAIFNSYAAR